MNGVSVKPAAPVGAGVPTHDTLPCPLNVTTALPGTGRLPSVTSTAV